MLNYYTNINKVYYAYPVFYPYNFVNGTAGDIKFFITKNNVTTFYSSSGVKSVTLSAQQEMMYKSLVARGYSAEAALKTISEWFAIDLSSQSVNTANSFIDKWYAIMIQNIFGVDYQTALNMLYGSGESYTFYYFCDSSDNILGVCDNYFQGATSYSSRFDFSFNQDAYATEYSEGKIKLDVDKTRVDISAFGTAASSSNLKFKIISESDMTSYLKEIYNSGSASSDLESLIINNGTTFYDTKYNISTTSFVYAVYNNS